MKFRHEIRGGVTRIELSGDLAGCDCLRAFWDCHVDADAAAVEIEMSGVDEMDGPSVAVLSTAVRSHLATGAEVTITHAPQMLAHTLYKIGLLDHAGLTLIDPRNDELQNP